MGIDISGGMMVGSPARDVSYDDQEGEYEFNEFLEDNNLDYMSPWYDADPSEYFVGYPVRQIVIDNIDVWLDDVKRKAKEFEEVTGAKAILYGGPNVY